MERTIVCNTQDEKWIVTDCLRALGLYFEAMACYDKILVVFNASDKEFKDFQGLLA